MTPLAPAHTSAIYAPVVERNLSWHTKLGDIGGPLKDYKALVRVGEGKSPQPVSVVKSSYKLVQTVDLLNAVETAMVQVIPGLLPEHVTIKDTVAEWGKHCIRDYVFKNVTASIGAKSDVALRIVVSNSYGGKSIRVLGGAIEFYCSNGLVLGEYDSAYHRHTSGLQLDKIAVNISNCITAFQNNVFKWKQWTGIKVPHAEAMSLFKAIASSPRMFHNLANIYGDEVIDRGDNLWSIVSTLTHYSTHFQVKATQNDTAPLTRMGRELEVRDWLKSPEFMALADA